MADVFTDSTQWSAIVQKAYDRSVEYKLRAIPQWRPLIDKRPAQQAMPGHTVTLTLHNDFASLATTPLTENVTPDAIAPPAPDQVNVVLNEYGAVAKWSLRLQALSFTKPDAELAFLMARHQADTHDSLVRAVADTGTKLVHVNGGALTSSGANGSVAATDIFDRNAASVGPSLLRRRNVAPKSGEDFVSLAHPDVLFDLMAQTGQSAWSAPHTYGGDTGAIYAGEVGNFMGARYIRTTRVTTSADGVGSRKVFTTYFLGRQAIVEASAIEPHVVVGLQTDPLKRVFPIGWYSLLGWSIYRDDALQRVRTTSSIQGLA